MTIIYTGNELAPANNQLAAWLNFTSDTAVRYSYKVMKRTTSPTSIDFSYTSADLITNFTNVIQIPVIGLYANYMNDVQVIFFDEAGTEVFNNIIQIDTRGQTYRDATIFHLEIEQTDPARFSSVWGNSWLMTTFCDGYDQNGDLRCCYKEPYRNEMLKTHNGYFYIGADEDSRWYGRRFFKIDILGNVIFEFNLKDNDFRRFSNTHDLVWDSAGNVYMIANDNPDRSTNTMRQDAWILKFSDQTGQLIWARNYTRDFDGAQILNNSPTNDAHLNSLSWVPAGNTTSEAIVVHTRSACVVFGISPNDGSILWVIDSGGFNAQFAADQSPTYINASGLTERENGAHTVFVTNNSKFATQTDTASGKFVLSLFDNRSCVDSDGLPVYRLISEDSTDTPYHTDPARVLFYAVDLMAGIATTAGVSITLPSDRVEQITDFMGGVFDHNDNYSIYTNLARSFFISDADGNIIATIYDVICTLDGYPEFPGECYRARLFSDTELASLISTAFTANVA